MSETRKIPLTRCLAFVIMLLLVGIGFCQNDHHSSEAHEAHEESTGDGMHHDETQHDDMHDDMNHSDMGDADGMHHDGMQHDEMHGDGMEMDHAAHGDELPADLDLSTHRKSENGHFVISYVTNPESPQLNQLHSWTLHIESADGHPVENAQVMISGDMPQHGHGLPTEPVVTQYLGDGDYLVEGV